MKYKCNTNTGSNTTVIQIQIALENKIKTQLGKAKGEYATARVQM